MTLITWIVLVILLNCVYSLLKQDDWSTFFVRTFLFECFVIAVWAIGRG